MASSAGSPTRSHICSYVIVALMISGLAGISESGPIPKRKREAADLQSCLSASVQLLKAANTAWLQLQEELSPYISCTYEDMDYEEVTEARNSTIAGCLADTTMMEGRCGDRTGRTLDKDTCFQAIHEDLKAYREELQHQANLSEAINDLIMALKFPGIGKTTSVPSPKRRLFSADLRMCKVVLAFRLRTVTITRIINHLKSTTNSS